MSWTIEEAIANMKLQVEDLGKIREKYPNATREKLPDGRAVWCSATIEPHGFYFCIKVEEDGQASVMVCPYEKIGELLVFAAPAAWKHAPTFFNKLMDRDPATWHRIIQNFES